MDPVTLIVAALAAGAAARTGETASQLVKDTYAGLKARVTRKVADQPAGTVAVQQYENDPDTWHAPLVKAVTDSGAAQDEAIIAAAQQLMGLLDPPGTTAGKYTVTIGNSPGAVVGDNATVHQSFGAATVFGGAATYLFLSPQTPFSATQPPLDPVRKYLLHLRDGVPPLVNQVDPLTLGVKPAIGTVADDGRDLPAYVSRTGDDDLRWAIAEGGLVLLHGRAASGKTRSAFEAMRRLRPESTLIVPAYPLALRELVDAGYEVRDTVVWLDDLERYLVSDGLDEGLLQQLCPTWRHDVVVLSTIRDEELARLECAVASHSYAELASVGFDPQGARVVAQSRGRRRIEVGQRLTIAERASINPAEPDPRVVDALASTAGFAEYLAAGPEMMRYWTTGDGPLFDLGQALVCAAVDCRRARLSTSGSR